MKKMLTLAFFFPALLFAQQKSRDLIKEFLYVKVSPSLLSVSNTTLLQPEYGLKPAIFGAVGIKMRYAAVGFSTGYFKFNHAGKIIPWGVDLTLTDFKRKKAFPVITAQWHKVHFKDYWSEGSMYSHHTFNITGKQMYAIGGGMAFQAFKQKIFITAGYSKLAADVVTGLSDYPNPAAYKNRKEDYKIVFLAASWVF
jgi:hypothetical protein